MRRYSGNRGYKCVLLHEIIAQETFETSFLWSLYILHSLKFTVFHLISGYLLSLFLSFIKSPIPTLQPITAQLHYTALCTDSQSQFKWQFDRCLPSCRVTLPFHLKMAKFWIFGFNFFLTFLTIFFILTWWVCPRITTD